MAAALVVAGCGSDSDTGSGGATTTAGSATTAASPAPAGPAQVLDNAAAGKLTVGIKFDQPGLGLKKPDGTFAGFDVDVARYVAKQLGVEESGVTLVETKSAEREDKIGKGEVDFIVATYSITDTRKEKVNFGGPYFVAHQDLLVKADNTDITGPEAMNGKILCSVTGSTSAQKVKDNFSKDVALQEFGTYSECVEQLKAGVVDAVTTDDVILAGFAAQSPGQFKVVGKGFSDENYGIGLMKGDAAGTTAINDAIKKMIEDGSWQKSLEANVGPSGYTIPEPPTVG
jgi:glutamate transport system substrate-binding protein